MKVLKNVLTLLIVIIIFSACSKDETVPFEAKFVMTVDGSAPNATVSIENQTTGATSFEWTYSEGADEDGSTLENPTSFTVDKAGEFTITLKASNGSEEKLANAKVTMLGYSAILTFSDIEFALNSGDATYGRLFSIKDSKIYKDSEISAEMATKIDLAFGSLSNTMYFFESPDNSDYGLTGAGTTKIKNYVTENEFAVATFDAMTDDENIKDIVITDDNESFGNSQPNIVLFQNAAGQKGVIKTKAVNADRLLVDIKVQKY